MTDAKARAILILLAMGSTIAKSAFVFMVCSDLLHLSDAWSLAIAVLSNIKADVQD